MSSDKPVFLSCNSSGVSVLGRYRDGVCPSVREMNHAGHVILRAFHPPGLSTLSLRTS